MPWPALASRWAYGMALISWRYLWQTTPLYRTDSTVGSGCQPPPVPPEVSSADLQLVDDGVGETFHRRFMVRIVDAQLDARELMHRVLGDLGGHMPREVVRISHRNESGRPLQRNDDFVVDMPGPWNGPVRVVLIDDTRLRLATRQGHLEAGQIEFHSADEGDQLVFEIEAWARPSNRVVRLLYSRMRLAKEIQLNMWVRFCKAAVATAGGRMLDGVHIETRREVAGG